MRRRLALFLILAGTFVAARTLVAQALRGGSPARASLALHALVVPIAQLALLETVRAFRARGNGAA